MTALWAWDNAGNNAFEAWSGLALTVMALAMVLAAAGFVATVSSKERFF